MFILLKRIKVQIIFEAVAYPIHNAINNIIHPPQKRVITEM